MTSDHTILRSAERAAQARGHALDLWVQEAKMATTTCVRCGRMSIADFSAEAAARDDQVRGSAVREDCDVDPDVCYAEFKAVGTGRPLPRS